MCIEKLESEVWELWTIDGTYDGRIRYLIEEYIKSARKSIGKLISSNEAWMDFKINQLEII